MLLSCGCSLRHRPDTGRRSYSHRVLCVSLETVWETKGDGKQSDAASLCFSLGSGHGLWKSGVPSGKRVVFTHTPLTPEPLQRKYALKKRTFPQTDF